MVCLDEIKELLNKLCDKYSPVVLLLVIIVVLNYVNVDISKLFIYIYHNIINMNYFNTNLYTIILMNACVYIIINYFIYIKYFKNILYDIKNKIVLFGNDHNNILKSVNLYNELIQELLDKVIKISNIVSGIPTKEIILEILNAVIKNLVIQYLNHFVDHIYKNNVMDENIKRSYLITLNKMKTDFIEELYDTSKNSLNTNIKNDIDDIIINFINNYMNIINYNQTTPTEKMYSFFIELRLLENNLIEKIKDNIFIIQTNSVKTGE